jgi:hypothetical protein
MLTWMAEDPRDVDEEFENIISLEPWQVESYIRRGDWMEGEFDIL